MKLVRTITLLSVAGGVLVAQIPNPTQKETPAADVNSSQPMPIYRVTVVERSIPAINYHHRRDSTRIDLKGTELMPRGEGEAKVESNVGSTRIDARFDKIPPASSFGPEFLTYVMWAITPEGRAQNLGEVKIENDDDAKLLSTTELQAFGLIVTAEPYFAVTQPSDVVVMENFIRDDTRGTFKPINAKYNLLRRGSYTMAMRPEQTQKLKVKNQVPLDLQEARNAIEIARSVGADRYAADTLQKALVELQNAEGFYSSKGDKKSLSTVAREATQTAEDARIISIRKMQEEREAAERAAIEAREAAANAEAERQARERADADKRALIAAQERREAEERSRRAELERQRFAAEKAQADQARLQAEQARSQAEQARAEAERARQQAEASQKQLESQQAALRQRLRAQLNMILETRESARGLIVNMSDVLFDFGKSTLKPGTREKLAKLSGILLANPGLKLEVEGHTDNIGSDEFNQRLSEQRAAAVRDYLVAEGIQSESITARGFGEGRPVVGNETDAGRQQNRRVEIVVSGDSIGSELTSQLDRQP